MATNTSTAANLTLDAALAYAARGWQMIPLHDVTQGHCSCKKGRDCGRDSGKHPRVPDWPHKATSKILTIRSWWRRWPQANVGIVPGQRSGLAIVDVDPRNGGDVALEELQRTNGPLPETPLVLTGGGGQHYYFQTRDDLPSVDLAPGINFLADGSHQAVAPPSLHPSGRYYEWEASSHPDDIPLAPVPDWIVAHVKDTVHQREIAAATLPEELPSVDVATLRVSSRMLKVIRLGDDPDSPYPSRSEALAAVYTAMFTAGYDDATIAAVVLNPAYGISAKPLDRKNPRSPFYWTLTKGWVAQDIARVRAKYAPRQDTTQHQNGTKPAAAKSWRDLLIVSKTTGKPSENVSNVSLLLQHHPDWHGRFWWDSVRSLPMLSVSQTEDTPISDTVIADIARWLGIVEGMPVRSLRLVERCVQALCQQTAHDLLQEWLAVLPAWDETPRLEDWLSDAASVVKDAYGMDVSRLLPVSMVARALNPGCLYRNVVILEGPEDTGKSTLVRTLASPAWYVEMGVGFDNKEAHMLLQGAWVAELAELDSLSRTEEARLKAFITLREDVWIPKYSNYRTSSPRRTIFVGTTNETIYLKGQTGNTRFLPIKTGEINVDVLLENRDQLFAEALVYYQKHPATWWHLSSDGQQEAISQRDQRRVVSVYEADLDDWLEIRRFQGEYSQDNARVTFVPNETSWSELARHYLQLGTPEAWKDMQLQKQIAQALKALKWESKVKKIDGKTQRIWRKTIDPTSCCGLHV